MTNPRSLTKLQTIGSYPPYGQITSSNQFFWDDVTSDDKEYFYVENRIDTVSGDSIYNTHQNPEFTEPGWYTSSFAFSQAVDYAGSYPDLPRVSITGWEPNSQQTGVVKTSFSLSYNGVGISFPFEVPGTGDTVRVSTSDVGKNIGWNGNYGNPPTDSSKGIATTNTGTQFFCTKKDARDGKTYIVMNNRFTPKNMFYNPTKWGGWQFGPGDGDKGNTLNAQFTNGEWHKN